MKKTLYAMSVMALMAVLSFLSCSKDADGYSGDVELGSNKLTIRTKAVSGGTTTMTVATPINIYVFDSQDKCIAQKTIESETEKADMKLQAGTYKIYAVAGATATDYSLPKKEDATPQSVVALNEGKQHSDLMTAASDVTLVDGEDSDLTLLMQRKVLMLTAVNIVDVPDDVTSISATLAPLYEDIMLFGNYSGEKGAQTITLKKQDDGTTWTADCNLFLLPSVGNPTVEFTFKTSDGKTKKFSYASKKPLVANYKVSINVNYLQVKEPTLKCNINGVDWAGSDVWSFDADERNFSVDGGDEPGGGTVAEGSVPHVGTLYKGCYVLKTEQSGASIRVTVIAPEQYNEWKYTKGDQNGIKAETDAVLSKLNVNGIVDWRLPSLSEITYVKDNIETINDNLTALGMQAMSVGTSSSMKLYLFDNGDGKIYGMYLKNGTIIEAPGNGVSVILRPFTTLLFTD